MKEGKKSPAGNKVTDQELLLRFQGGDTSAFEAILSRYEQPLLRFAKRYRGEGAQDLVQEVFLRLIQDMSKLHEVQNLSAWLYRVARNLAIDLARKEERMQRRHQLAAVPESQGAITGALETKEAAEVVSQKLLNLPEKQRDVLVLKVQEPKSYREISQITGLIVSNVGYLIHKGMKALAAELRTAGVV